MMFAFLAMPLLRHSQTIVTLILLAWGVSFGAMPLCFSVWIQRATPDLPEAGSTLFVGTIQVAIAVGSLFGGAAVERQLMTQVNEKTRESHYRQTRIDQLILELSVIKRLQFGRRSKQFTAEQLSLLDKAINEDLD